MGIDNSDGNQITMEQFASAIFAGVSHSGLIWNHFVSWWKLRDDPNVLWIFFEDLKDDLRACVLKIGAFMKIKLTEDLVNVVTKKASYSFMSLPENRHHFDSHFDFDAVKVRMGLGDEDSCMATKVNKGKVGGRASIPPMILSRLDECWKTIVEENTGIASYEELRETLSVLQ
jgi:hypothetical protein